MSYIYIYINITQKNMKARNMESLKDKFKNVIVKTPASSMVDGITSAPELGKPIYELALEQHAKYVEA